MIDITTIPINILEKDLLESKRNIILCEVALNMGVLSSGGGSIGERLEANKYFVEVITAELERREILFRRF